METLKGTPLDYADRNNWMLYQNDTGFEADTLFLYPTCASEDCRTVVCDVTDGMKHKAMHNFLKSGDAFTSFTNVYAPYYRQISTVGIMQGFKGDELTETVRKNITRTDVFAALDHFFQKINKGRPYFFVSHSQGSCCFKVAFDEYMVNHPEYMERLIASYNIGYYFPDAWFKANPHIKKAEGETDTGCLITWNTEGPGAHNTIGPTFTNDGFCINPLNWKTDETPAPLSANLGSVEVGEDNIQVLVPGKADAVIDSKRGSIICSTDTKDIVPSNPIFDSQSMHMEDCALYYCNMAENAKKRMEKYLKRYKSEYII